MKDRPNTTIPSDLTPPKEDGNVDAARFRSILYTFISSLYSDPSSERFRLLFEESFRRAVATACEALDGIRGEEGDSLKNLAETILDHLSGHERSVGDEYVATFGHTLSKPTAPYELEHLKNEDVFYRNQRLADLGGFYMAFGLVIDKRERSDHISVEAEFLAHLLAKEVFAVEHDLGNDKIEVCRKALRDFFNDHFGGWVTVFVQNVSTLSAGEFYPLICRFSSRFLHIEEDQQHEAHRTAKK